MAKKITGLLVLALILIGSMSTISYGAQKDLECFMESGNLVVSQQNYDSFISPKTTFLQLFLKKPDGSKFLACNALGIVNLIVTLDGKDNTISAEIPDKWETQKLTLKKQSPEEIITRQIKNYQDQEKGLAFSLVTEVHFYKDQPYFDFSETLTNSNKKNDLAFNYIALNVGPPRTMNRVTITDEKVGKQASEGFTPETNPRFYGTLAVKPSSFIYFSDTEKWQTEFSSLDKYPLFYAFTSNVNYYISYFYYNTRCFNTEKKRNGAFTLAPEESISFTMRITPRILP